MRGRAMRVPGHTLRYEGAPHDEAGYPVLLRGTAGEGRAKCSCGAMSGSLPSARARKRWHDDHKLAQLPCKHRAWHHLSMAGTDGRVTSWRECADGCGEVRLDSEARR